MDKTQQTIAVYKVDPNVKPLSWSDDIPSNDPRAIEKSMFQLTLDIDRQLQHGIKKK